METALQHIPLGNPTTFSASIWKVKIHCVGIQRLWGLFHAREV